MQTTAIIIDETIIHIVEESPIAVNTESIEKIKSNKIICKMTALKLG